MRTLACSLCWTGEVEGSGLQIKRPHFFQGTLTLNRIEIVFSNRILVTLVQYSVLLPIGPDLSVVCF